jgi:hypothetical protein
VNTCWLPIYYDVQAPAAAAQAGADKLLCAAPCASLLGVKHTTTKNLQLILHVSRQLNKLHTVIATRRFHISFMFLPPWQANIFPATSNNRNKTLTST